MPLYSGMLASGTAPIGSPRRGHMLMSLCWIPKARISRALQLDSFLRRCQRPNEELGDALAILCGYRLCRLPVQRLLSRFTKSRLFNANIRTIVKRIAHRLKVKERHKQSRICPTSTTRFSRFAGCVGIGAKNAGGNSVPNPLHVLQRLGLRV